MMRFGLGMGSNGGIVNWLEPTEANFPFLANSVLWHQDDVTDDTSNSWTDRFGSVVVTAPFGANWLKNSDGVYRAVPSNIGYSGALPDPTLKHVVAFNVEKSSPGNGSGPVFYNTTQAGTAGFIRALTQDVASPTTFKAGVNTTNLLTFTPPASLAFDADVAVGLTYANFAVAASTGSISWRTGKVSGVNTTASLLPVLTGDMTTALNPANNPSDQIAFSNGEAQGIRIKMFGLLIFASAPPSLQEAVEVMRDHPGYLPAVWKGLT